MIETVRRFAAWQITVLTWDFRDLELNKSRYILNIFFTLCMYSFTWSLSPCLWFIQDSFFPSSLLPPLPSSFIFSLPASLFQSLPPFFSPSLFFYAPFIAYRTSCVSHYTQCDNKMSTVNCFMFQGAMMSIAFKEGLKIPPQAMDQIIIGANQDVRQVGLPWTALMFCLLCYISWVSLSARHWGNWLAVWTNFDLTGWLEWPVWP